MGCSPGGRRHFTVEWWTRTQTSNTHHCCRPQTQLPERYFVLPLLLTTRVAEGCSWAALEQGCGWSSHLQCKLFWTLYKACNRNWMRGKGPPTALQRQAAHRANCLWRGQSSATGCPQLPSEEYAAPRFFLSYFNSILPCCISHNAWIYSFLYA